MRSNYILLEVIDSMNTLYKYLYMSKEYKIIVNNRLTNLELFMDDEGNFMCRNMNYPELPATRYNDRINLLAIDEIVRQLKEQKSDKEYFETKWEEIEAVVSVNLTLNLHNSGRMK